MENAAKFGLRLELVNVIGYTVLANSTDSSITLSAIVTWGEEKLPLTHTFPGKHSGKLCPAGQ